MARRTAVRALRTTPGARRTIAGQQSPSAPCRRPPGVAGVSGRLSVPVSFDHLGERRATVSYQLHGPPGPDGRLDLNGSSGLDGRPGLPRPSGPDGPSGSLGSPDTAPVVALGGISAGRRLAPTPETPGRGWWPGVAGAGAVLDPASRLLVGIDYLGGPTPDAGLLHPVTSHDQARALAALLDRLEMPRASLVGASYGGMVALAFAELFPERVSRLVVLCAAHRTHPMATAWRAVQREAVRLGVRAGLAAEGLSLARALAMTTYRSAEEFENRFSWRPLPSVAPEAADRDAAQPKAAQPEAADPDAAQPKAADREAADPDAARPQAPEPPSGPRPSLRFPVENYLHARGTDFAGRFDAQRFLALSESIDLHRTEPASLPPSALLVSVASDVLVPPWLVERLAEQGGGARHVVVDSPFGHDAFLKEVEQVSALVRSGLA